MDIKEGLKRYILFVVGLFFLSMGVALVKIANLGVSPISSIPNILSIHLESMTLGNLLFYWNILLLLGQVVILGKNFNPVQLMQVPLSFLFGYFTDFCMDLFSWLDPSSYPLQLAIMAIGILVLAFGTSLTIIADVVLNAGEGFVKALSLKSPFAFGQIKVGFDILCVVIAGIFSLYLFNGQLFGVREGTLLSALATGFIVDFFIGLWKDPITSYLEG